MLASVSPQGALDQQGKNNTLTREWEPMLGGSDLAPSLEVVWKARQQNAGLNASDTVGIN